MIKLSELAKGQAIPANCLENLYDLWAKINIIRRCYGKPMIVTSGYRTVEHEKKQGRSGKSDHCSCKAVDIYDPDRSLAKWVKENQKLIKSIPLWIENTDYTKNWVHFTTQQKSQTFFIPY